MADQHASQDGNQFPAMLGHSGTAGTAETRKVVVDDDGSFGIASLHGVVKARAVAIGTVPTLIPGTASPLANRKAFIFYNSGTATVYIGGSTVAAGTSGFPVGTADYSPPIDLGQAALYGICSTAGGTISLLEVS